MWVLLNVLALKYDTKEFINFSFGSSLYNDVNVFPILFHVRNSVYVKSPIFKLSGVTYNQMIIDKSVDFDSAKESYDKKMGIFYQCKC